jgi:hypothetical protein
MFDHVWIFFVYYIFNIIFSTLRISLHNVKLLFENLLPKIIKVCAVELHLPYQICHLWCKYSYIMKMIVSLLLFQEFENKFLIFAVN